jgi:hypothetical protein
MLGKIMRWLPILVVLGLASGAVAEEQEVVVGAIPFPKHQWGSQVLPFDVTNNTDWVKFLIVETEVGFEGSYVNPHRIVRTNFVLEPSTVTKLQSQLVIPPNFGQLTLWIRIYDVIDTLDDMSLGTQVFEQPFKIKFRMPDEVAPYFKERITLPPMVGNYGLFDNELYRIIMVMISEGKKISQIAKICQADSAYIDAVAAELDVERFIKKSGDTCWTQMSVITSEEAKDGRKLADRISDSLAQKITVNLSRRSAVLDSLKTAGVYDGDSTNFSKGVTVLYQTYPLVGGLYLWQVLGQKFIVGSRSLEIYLNTNNCDPRINAYMYMVLGGDYLNGHQYYAATALRSGYSSQFGDSIPGILCKPGFEHKFQLTETVDWNYAKGNNPEAFPYDTTLVNPVLRTIDVGMQPILDSALKELRQISKGYRSSDLPMAVRYWFWNLTASLTLDKMTKSGTLKRSGNGQYKFSEARH